MTKCFIFFVCFMVLPNITTPKQSPEAKIKVKLSDKFIDQVFRQFSELLSEKMHSWRYSLDFDDNFMTSTKDGTVLIGSFRDPILTVGKEPSSKKISITATFPALTLQWNYQLYASAFRVKVYWGRARLNFRLTNLAMTFNLPGVSLTPEGSTLSSGNLEYALKMDGPVSWTSKDWYLQKWNFEKEFGQGEDYGAKLLQSKYQNQVLRNLTRTLANCLDEDTSVNIDTITRFLNDSVGKLPKLSASEPLLKVNNDKLAKLNVAQLYEYVSIGLYSNNRSVWFSINLKSTIGTQNRRRHVAEIKNVEELEADCEDEKPDQDLSVAVKRVPYKIDLSSESAQLNALKSLDYDLFHEKVIGPWKDEVHTLVDRGNEVKLTGHNVSFQQIGQTTGSRLERKGSWTFSEIEVDRHSDFFGKLKTYSIPFTISATSMTVNTRSSGTSFFHNYLSSCKMSNNEENPCTECHENEQIKSYVQSRMRSLGDLISKANSNLTIEWKVNLPSQFSYSSLKSDWTVYESVMDVQLHSNILNNNEH